MIGIAMLFAVIAAPCDLGLVPNESSAGVTVTVRMTGDRTITAHTADPRNPEYPDEVLKPGMMNYDAMIKLVGGISPGETKDIPTFIGSISMNEDGSFKIGGNDVADMRIVRPGDRDYTRIHTLVGALKPGNWVALTAPSPRNCKLD